MTMHTVADNQVNFYLQELFDRKKPDKLSEVLKILREIPEYVEKEKIVVEEKKLNGEE